MKPRRICIVGMDAYGLLSGEGDLRYIGGESVQHVLLARAWRDLGHDVSLIVFDDTLADLRARKGEGSSSPVNAAKYRVLPLAASGRA